MLQVEEFSLSCCIMYLLLDWKFATQLGIVHGYIASGYTSVQHYRKSSHINARHAFHQIKDQEDVKEGSMFPNTKNTILQESFGFDSVNNIWVVQ